MKDSYLIIGFLEIALIIFMQWQIYLKKIIITFSISSFAVAAFLFADGVIVNSFNMILLSFLTAIVRAVFIPLYMYRKLDTQYREREIRSIVPVAGSIIISLFLVIFAYVVYRFTLYGLIHVKGGSIPIALIFQGIFLIISRNNTFVQLIGYMVMENAIFLFTGYIFPELPFIIEVGILLDLIGIVMVSGIIMRLRENQPSVLSGVREFRG